MMWECAFSGQCKLFVDSIRSSTSGTQAVTRTRFEINGGFKEVLPD